MKFIDVVKNKQNNLFGNRQPTIVFLGDSVTHGCFDIYVQNDTIQTYMETEKAYHEKVKEIFRLLYPTVPLSVINAGISGDRASGGLKRLERDALSYKPDLLIVCYGLNDAKGTEKGLKSYIDSLREIFNETKSKGAEVIFLTPNLRTDRIDIKFNDELLNECARDVMSNENDGWLEKYLNEARLLCGEMKIPICDCNKIWNILKLNDVDINNLLSNRVNHPVEKMHWLFAYELVKTMFVE